MRLTDVLDAEVVGRDGARIGRVSDVRLVQDGPILGEWGAAFRIRDLIVTPRRTADWFGYERPEMNGPWMLNALFRFVHRGAVLVDWSLVTDCSERRIVVDGERSSLPQYDSTRGGAA